MAQLEICETIWGTWVPDDLYKNSIGAGTVVTTSFMANNTHSRTATVATLQVCGPASIECLSVSQGLKTPCISGISSIFPASTDNGPVLTITGSLDVTGDAIFSGAVNAQGGVILTDTDGVEWYVIVETNGDLTTQQVV